MRNIPIPRYIDAPPQLFFWELDEFFILAFMFGCGIIVGGLATFGGIALGLFMVRMFRRYKTNGLPGQLNHLAHWKNIFNLNEFYPNGGVRSLIK